MPNANSHVNLAGKDIKNRMSNNYLKRIRYISKVIYRLIRVQNLIILLLTQIFVSFFLVSRNITIKETFTDPGLILLILSTLLIAAGGYIINDYYDVKIDVINKPQRVVVGRFLNRRIAMAGHFVFTTLGVAIGFLITWEIGLVNSVCGFLLWLYSNWLKRLPFIGNFVVATLTAVAVYLPAYYFSLGLQYAAIYASFAFFISLMREIIKDMEDMKGDASFGCKTLPIIWGIRKTKHFVYGITIIFLIFLFYFSSAIGTYFFVLITILAVLPVLFLVFRLSKSDTIRDFKRLSKLCKFIMLSGLFSMVFI